MKSRQSFPQTFRSRFGKVSVYRTANGPYTTHRIAWNMGRHRFKEAVSDPDKAVARAKEILEDLKEGLAPRARGTAAEWAYYRECERLLGGVPLMRAVEHWLADEGKVEKTRASKSLRELCDGFCEAKKAAGRSDRYLQTVKLHLDALCRALRKPVELVKPQDLDAHLASIPNTRTRRNHRATVVTLFRWAKAKGWLPRDAPTAAEATDIPETAAADPGVIPAQALGDALRVAWEKDRPMVPYLAIAAFAGVRSAEICRLTWEDNIDLTRGIISLGSSITKKRRRRLVYMEPVLVEWLVATRGTGPVVPVKQPHARLKALRGTTPWPTNALRHTAVSCLMAVHRNAAAVADQCGHTEAEMNRSYKALVTREDADKWFQLSPQAIWHHTQTQQKAG